MSLTIFPKAYSVGFSPQYQSPKPEFLGSNSATHVDSSGQVSGDKADLSTVKVISDDNDVSSEENTGLTTSDKKTRVRVDPESQELIIEVVDDKTGKEVRQIPGEQQLRLNKGISEYNSVAFDSVPVDSVSVDNVSLDSEKPA